MKCGKSVESRACQQQTRRNPNSEYRNAKKTSTLAQKQIFHDESRVYDF